MSEANTDRLKRSLLPQLQNLQAEMWAEFERVTQHIDDRDPDQALLIQSELDRILKDYETKTHEIITKEILQITAIEPMMKMFGIEPQRS